MKKVKYQAPIVGLQSWRDTEPTYVEAEAYRTTIPGLLVGHPLRVVAGEVEPDPYTWRLIHERSGWTIGVDFDVMRHALVAMHMTGMRRFDWTRDAKEIVADGDAKAAKDDLVFYRQQIRDGIVDP